VRAAALCVAAVAVLGCDQRRSAPRPELASPGGADRDTAPAPSCGSVIAHLRNVLVVEVSSIPGATVMLERALAIAHRSCRRDTWPEPMRRCALRVPLWGAGSGTAGLSRCLDQIPAALRASLEREVSALRD
jgi:hypothetical protein